MLPLEIQGTILSKGKVIDSLDIGEDEVLLFEVRTQDSRGQNNAFPLIEAK